MATKTFEFEQTSLPSNFNNNLRDNYGMVQLVDTAIPNMYRMIFAAMADTLCAIRGKSKDKIGFILVDNNKNFKFGMIMYYIKPEEESEEDSGNWYLECTFDENDMNDCDTTIDSNSDAFIVAIGREANNILSGNFNDASYIGPYCCNAIDTIIDFLDLNANEGDTIEVNLKSVFNAAVEVENGLKVMSIVPGEYIKQIIKKDSIL